MGDQLGKRIRDLQIKPCLHHHVSAAAGSLTLLSDPTNFLVMIMPVSLGAIQIRSQILCPLLHLPDVCPSL